MFGSIVSNPDFRHDAVLLFDCFMGNPNGDPDADNQPRMIPETQQGEVTDACLKRKWRDYTTMKCELAVAGLLPNEDLALWAKRQIYVERGSILGLKHMTAYGDHPPQKDCYDAARDALLEKYFDARCSGFVGNCGDPKKLVAAQNTGEDGASGKGKSGKGKSGKGGKLLYNCGQVQGPFQFTFGTSYHPIEIQYHCLTRVALTNPDDGDEGSEDASHGTMGRKYTINYGLYAAYIFFNVARGRKTGVSREDLELMWEAITNMFEHDRSSSRGIMTNRGLYVYSHSNPIGNAPAQDLFERIHVELKPEVLQPRRFQDYRITVDDDHLPSGVTLTRLVDYSESISPADRKLSEIAHEYRGRNGASEVLLGR